MTNTSGTFIDSLAQGIGDRWSLQILFCLSLAPHRFNDLKSQIKNISHDQLTKKLHSLHEQGWTWRQEFSEYPPRVEYGLSSKGRQLIPLLKECFFIQITNSRAGLPFDIQDVTLFLRATVEHWSEALGQIGIILHGAPGGLQYLQFNKQLGMPVQFLNSPKDFHQIEHQLEIKLSDFSKLISGSANLKQIWHRQKGAMSFITQMLPFLNSVSSEKVESKNSKSHEYSINGEYGKGLTL
jgi:DNA-binding HxlR family transcriptional regulator